jgi:hypothetical protein
MLHCTKNNSPSLGVIFALLGVQASILTAVFFRGFSMLGLMQSQQLLISSLIEFADRHHHEGEIVSRRVEGDIHRCTYRDVAKRSRKAAMR